MFLMMYDAIKEEGEEWFPPTYIGKHMPERTLLGFWLLYNGVVNCLIRKLLNYRGFIDAHWYEKESARFCF